MPKSRIALAAILLSGLGCQATPHKRVYVDLEAVLASYKASPLPSKPPPRPPGGLPAKTVGLPPVPGKTIIVEGTTTAQAQRLLDENRRKAVRELTRLLAQRYVREVERAGAERIRALEPGRQTAMERAEQLLRAEFEAYADKRGDRVARLTSIVGFPDPNPLSLPPSQPVPAFVQRSLDEAAALRKEIHALDEAYDARAGEILAQVGKQYDVDLTSERVAIERDRAAALARAEQEATNEATETYKALAPLLMGSAGINLPGQPGQSVTLPAVPPPSAAPDVRERTLSLQERRTILTSQLQIWLALNRYELADRPQGDNDATAQFVRWRQERKL